MSYREEDRQQVALGTVLSVIGGLWMAGFKALGFVLRAIFGGPAYGLFAIAQNLAELLAYLLLGGFNDAIVYHGARHVPREAYGDVSAAAGDDTRLYRALATCIAIPLLVAVGVAGALTAGAGLLHATIWRAHDPLLIDLVQILAWVLPLLVLLQLPAEAMKIHLRFQWQVGVVQVLFPTLAFLFSLAGHYVFDLGIRSLAYALLAAALVSAPISLLGFSRSFSLPRTVRAMFGPWDREVIHFALPQSLNMMLNLGLVRVDSLMLSGFVSANAVGVYSLVSDLTQLIRLAKMAFSGVFSPLVARYQAVGNREGIREGLYDLVQLTSALSIPLLVLMMSMYPDFILGPDETWQYDRWFPWLLCAGPMMSCFFGLAGNLLLMTGHARLLLANAVACGLLNLVLNALFIPTWGLLGAALATAISNVAISSLQILEMAHFEQIRLSARLYARTVLAALPVVVGTAALHGPVFEVWTSALPWASAGVARGLWVLTAIVAFAGLLILPGAHNPYRQRIGAAWRRLRQGPTPPPSAAPG